MLLFIDTSDYSGLRFALVPSQGAAKKIAESSRELAFNENYKTLELLQQFLKANRVPPSSLTKIVVCSGPGSFTGIRVGIAMVQALGFALNIPVSVLPKNKIPKNLAQLWKLKSTKKLTLNYGREPNITPPKKSVQSKRT